jgi:hypothetical protein
MNLRVLACALIGALAVAVPAAVASDEPSTPVRGALAGSTRPAASVNICGEGGSGTIGVRVAAPYRGEDLEPWVRVHVEWYSSRDGSWHPVSAGGDSGWYRAAPAGSGAWTGYTFPFVAPNEDRQLVMRGIAEVEWRDDNQIVDRGQAATPVCQLAGPD